MTIPGLEQAYRRTLYRARLAAGEVELRVGEPSAALDAELAARGLDAWGWLTAVNPLSQPLGDGENARRLAALDVELAGAGWEAAAGVAIDPDSRWPEEASRLVFGASPGELAALAARWEQHAYLVGRRGGPVELRWTRPAAQLGAAAPQPPRR
ncbi:MAG: DUF3293 domain-containing protein [Thermoanaerobaculia bacterium]|nr:DUF3293 domain-containing protein [Thermoanaerobaculia bacterium]